MTLTSLFHRLFPPAPGTAAYARELLNKKRAAEEQEHRKNRATAKQTFAENPQSAIILEQVLKAAARGETANDFTIDLETPYAGYQWNHPLVIGALEYFESLGYTCYYLSRSSSEGYAIIRVDWRKPRI